MMKTTLRRKQIDRDAKKWFDPIKNGLDMSSFHNYLSYRTNFIVKNKSIMNDNKELSRNFSSANTFP